MNASCLESLQAILGRTFVSNQELNIMKKECDKHLNCVDCRYYKEVSK